MRDEDERDRDRDTEASQCPHTWHSLNVQILSTVDHVEAWSKQGGAPWIRRLKSIGPITRDFCAGTKNLNLPNLLPRTTHHTHLFLSLPSQPGKTSTADHTRQGNATTAVSLNKC